MAQLLVNATSGTSDASSTTIAATAAAHTTGNANYVDVGWSNNVTCSSVTDTAGNTYVSTGQKASNGTSDHSEVFYAENVTGNASNVVTAHFSGSATFRRCMVHHVSGSATSGSFTTGQGGTGVATGGSVTTSSWTTTSANAYLFAGFGSTGGVNHTNVVAGTSYTKHLDDIGTDSGTEDRIVSSTGTYTAGYTASSGTQTWWLAAASFIAAGAGGTDVTVTAPAAAITLAGLVPALHASSTVTAPAGAIVLAAPTPAPVIGTTVVAPAGVLTLAGQAPTITYSGTVTAVVGAVVLAGLVSTVTAGTLVTATVASLTLSTYPPTLTGDIVTATATVSTGDFVPILVVTHHL